MHIFMTGQDVSNFLCYPIEAQDDYGDICNEYDDEQPCTAEYLETLKEFCLGDACDERDWLK